MSSIIPEIDTAAVQVDIRSTQGDPINVQWQIIGAASWAGSYVTKVRVDDEEITLACTVVAGGIGNADAIFSIVDDDPGWEPTQSGYPWSIKADCGPTRYGGLWRVEEAVL